jgi:hypothetical protein
MPVTSCALNRRPENVIVGTIVIAELKFSDAQRQILGADFMERADDTALEDAPKCLNRLGVYRADDVLSLGVIDGSVGEFHTESVIASPLVSCRAN